MRKWTRKTSKLKLLLASVLFAACNESTPSSFPLPQTVPFETTTPSSSSSTTTPVESPSPTVPSIPQSPETSSPETVAEPVEPQEPILCPEVGHPAHHQPCEVAEQPEPVVPGSSELQACIAHYESTSGLHPNIYQFEQGTWEAYGGTGTPSTASKAEQDAVFWRAWEDAGEHHWLAQKGRCF